MMEFTFGTWGNPSTKPLVGYGFKSVNVGKTQISGIELSLNGQGKISEEIKINLLGGYTYMNHKSLVPNEVYAYGYSHGEALDQSMTYNNSSSDSTVLKYRYNHIAKLDLEIVYKKISLGGSFRYNSFMSNIDKIFTEDLINNGIPGYFDGIPGINNAREEFKHGDFIIDMRAGYSLNDKIRLGIIINNMLNREYMSRPANMEIQRTFAFQLSVKL